MQPRGPRHLMPQQTNTYNKQHPRPRTLSKLYTPYILNNTSLASLSLQHYSAPFGHPSRNMEFQNILPEILLLVAENLSLEDLSNLRSTCHRIWNTLTPRFQKLCLQDVGELTALQWAAVRGHAKLIELAMSNGAEVDAPLLGELTIPDLGVRHELYEYDLRHPCELANTHPFFEDETTKIRTPLFLAACCGNLEAIEVLLAHGARTQYVGGIMTPAHAAASRGDVACMQAFVRPGFDINARGAEERTFLHDATLGGSDMMEFILQLDGGTNLVNARTSTGLTPMHCITWEVGNRDCRMFEVELLVQHGADIYAKDNDENTPAHTFAYQGDFGCLQVLLDAGLDLYICGI